MERQDEEAKFKTDVQVTKKEVQQLTTPPTSFSPSHEFSFTISLIPTTKSPPPPLSPPPFDLSPADEIFFHGHLLPLHLLSHHPISADSSRSSTNSLESCTFTLKDELLYYHDHDHDSVHDDDDIIADDHENTTHHENLEGKVRGKSRSFSHLFLKWRKYYHHHDHDHDHDHDHHQEKDEHHHHHGHDDDHKQKNRKSKLDIVKRYMRLVKPFNPFRHKRVAGSAKDFLRQPASFNSYSGSLRVLRAGRRSEFSSAPVSISTSPTNSGLLVASSGHITPTIKNNDGTMDELKSAIQAAIAHCKNSIAEEEEEEEEIAVKAAT